MRRLFLPLVLLTLVATPAPRARAEEPRAQCTLLEVQATTEKKGIDPKLERWKSKFSKPPFRDWDTFKLLREQQVTAERKKPVTADRVNGKVTLLLHEKSVEQGGKPRLRLGVDLDAKDGRRFFSTIFTFDSGDGVLIAGEPYEGGTYVLAVSCSAS